MATQRRPAHPQAAGPQQAGAVVEPEKEATCPDKPLPQNGTAPRAGRTGGLGARAERPSDNRRKPDDKNEPVRRGAKAPSASAKTHSDERSSK